MSVAKRRKNCAPPHFLSPVQVQFTSFGERFRDGQYSLLSFLFAVLLLTVPPVTICKSEGHVPPCPMESASLLLKLKTVTDPNKSSRIHDSGQYIQLFCNLYTTRHVVRIISLGATSVFGADIFRVLLYCYSPQAISTVSVTEYTNIIVVIE